MSCEPTRLRVASQWTRKLSNYQFDRLQANLVRFKLMFERTCLFFEKLVFEDSMNLHVRVQYFSCYCYVSENITKDIGQEEVMQLDCVSRGFGRHAGG